MGYGDYLEQLTYLLFLKLAHEYAQPPHNRDTHIPRSCNWTTLRNKTGEPLEAHYLTVLHKLGEDQSAKEALLDAIKRRFEYLDIHPRNPRYARDLLDDYDVDDALLQYGRRDYSDDDSSGTSKPSAMISTETSGVDYLFDRS